MKNNYRRKTRKNSQTFPQMTLNDFELYVAIQLEDMVKADRAQPVVENYGTKTFGSAGLRDEGHGVIVRCKDGSQFVLNIKALSDNKG
jgi:hypothetical protein